MELIGLGVVAVFLGGVGLAGLVFAPKTTAFVVAIGSGGIFGWTQAAWGESALLSAIGGAALGAVAGGVLAGVIAAIQAAFPRDRTPSVESPAALVSRLKIEAEEAGTTAARPPSSPEATR